MSGSNNTDAPPDQNTGYTVADLVNMALEQLGVGVGGQNSDTQGLTSGVMHMNLMLAQWQRRRWLVPNLVDSAFMSTGKSEYIIGPGGDLDIPVRPDKLEAAYARLALSQNFVPVSAGDFADSDFSDSDFTTAQNGLDPVLLSSQQFTTQFDGAQFPTQDVWSGTPNPIDYALTEICSREDYSALGLKGLRSWPNYFFYSPGWPRASFMPWPIPQGSIWELHVVYKQPLQSNLKATDNINLPPEYWDAIMWRLAARLAPSYGQQPNPLVVSEAKAALNTIRTSNTKIPTLGMPGILTPISNPFYWPGLEIQRL